MKTIFSILITSILFLTTGCSNANSGKELADSFYLSNIKVEINEAVKMDIALHKQEKKILYHTPKEMNRVLNIYIIKYLKEFDMYSTGNFADALNIHIDYTRKFTGDGTPFVKQSLVYPIYDYTIAIMSGSKTIRKIKREKETYYTNSGLNKKIVSGLINHKKYEIRFIKDLAFKIVEDIARLK